MGFGFVVAGEGEGEGAGGELLVESSVILGGEARDWVGGYGQLNRNGTSEGAERYLSST